MSYVKPNFRDKDGHIRTVEASLTKAERHRLNESLDGRKLEKMTAKEQWELFFTSAHVIFG